MRGLEIQKLSWAWVLTCTAGCVFALCGCDSGSPPPAKKTTAATTSGGEHGHEAHNEHGHGGHGHEGHEHPKGPHQGMLVEVGEETAHIEIVLDAATGKLSAYILDGGVKQAVPVSQSELELTFQAPLTEAEKKAGALPDFTTVKLAAVNAKEGKASEFSATEPKLKGVKEFNGQITLLKIDKGEYKLLKVNYPEGDHHHH